MTTELSKRERFLLAARGEEVDRPPIWIMRQAGRYMPDYMAIRKVATFKDLCHDVERCCQVSLLPQDLLGVDALIVFNDILIPLEAMGLQVEFLDQGGPQIMNPPRTEPDLDHFLPASFDNPTVATNLQELRKRAIGDPAILGFAGAPFTLLAYAVEGKMSRNHDQIKKLIFQQPELAHEMLRRLTDTVANYLIVQIQQGGADAVQLFESCANILDPGDLSTFALPYQQKVIRRVKAACPTTPVINFSRGGGDVLQSQVNSGADVVSVEWTLTLAEARSRVPASVALQGNLDPMVMTVPEVVEERVHAMLEGFDWKRGFIANLGHGITPQASVAAARRFVEVVQSLNA